MKHLRKMFTLVIAFVTCIMMGNVNVAFAQTEGTAATGKGSITINNAAKGETYSVVKVFGATLTDDSQAGSDASGIAYTGTIPDELTGFFYQDDIGNIFKQTDYSAYDNDETKFETALLNAVQAWAKTQPTTASAESDGSKLVFQGLEYGYYAVLSTQGATVTIDSIRPNATVNDKNSKDISVVKKVENESYSIGDTVNYTATFNTVNYYGAGANAQQVIKYTITDTLPEFLEDVEIDSVQIKETVGNNTTTTDITGKSFDANGSFYIDWAEEVTPATDPKTYNNLYANGAQIIVNYHGTLTSVSNINTANTNTVKIQPTVVKPDGTEDEPWDDSWQYDAIIKTYGTALKKVDGDSKEALDGAKFTVAGLVVEAITVTNDDGTTTVEPGVYRVTSYNPNDTSVTPTEMSTNEDGKLYIIGLASDAQLVVTETKAPDGYNKLPGTVTLTPQVLTEDIYETSGTRHYDAKGNLVSESSTYKEERTVDKNYTMLDASATAVENNKGTELPSTGGIGTTIFYIVGGVMVAGAVVFLLTKRRLAGNE